MKHLKSLLVAFILTISTLTFSFAQEKKTAISVIKTNIYCDHCKECETCGKNFQTKMLKIYGVKMYELDEKAMTITVYYNIKKTNLETIKKEISKLGYDADDIKADSKAYENLDNCCKKA
ncbi:cation transporter [Flavobacterium sp. GT3R68]|uniref:cation transporter n=1 Tax=Flavobacterium sp. GT3R68 TaxID=2594437 RepID=UPI0013152D9F|nr:cation transporter [Flavobacterium sp. GT3R68]